MAITGVKPLFSDRCVTHLYVPAGFQQAYNAAITIDILPTFAACLYLLRLTDFEKKHADAIKSLAVEITEKATRRERQGATH